MTDPSGEDRRPNILLICTDQQRFSALGAAGNEEIHTPTLDRLAAEGVLFENCYVQNPVCGPSRASLMTGRYVQSHGEWANGVALPSHEQVFSLALADAGYDCGLTGKLHLAACFGGRTEPRRDDGFRVWRWAHDPSHRSPDNAYHQWLQTAHPDLWQAVNDPDMPMTFGNIETRGHFSRWISTETIAFLRASRQREQPFFFVANFFDPHHAFDAPEEYVKQYEPKTLSRPTTRDGELATKPPIFTEASARSYAGHERGYLEYSPAELQETKAAYYAMVTLIDDEVGRILDALDTEGLAENTLVIFTSDHGEMLGDHQLMLKGPMMYEEAVRVPLIMRWPGQLPAGDRRAELIQWIDLAPTILEAAGLPPMPRGQGDSLFALARGDSTAWARDWALCEYRNSGHAYDPPVHTTMLRHERWKLVVHHGYPSTARERTGELYDLVADPYELDNRWDDSAYADRRRELHELLMDVLVATQDRSQPREAHW